MNGLSIQYIGEVGRHVHIRGGFWGIGSFCRGYGRGKCGLCEVLSSRGR